MIWQLALCARSQLSIDTNPIGRYAKQHSYTYIANRRARNKGIREITETYKLFARSFSDENLITTTPHVEFLIDKQGYIRARWLPAESEAWSKIAGLLSQVELLRNEKPRAAAPDDHVH